MTVATHPASPAGGMPGGADDLAAPIGAVRDSLAVATWTVVSRVTGVLRGVTVASVLGATYLANTYQFTNSLPNLVFYGVLAGSLFSSLLVPALVGHLDRGDLAAAGRVAGGLLGAVAGATMLVVPLAVVVGPQVLRLTTLGPVSAEVSGQARVGGLLLLMLMPQVLLYAVVGTATAAMNAQRKFALAAAAPALENIGTIVVLAVVAVQYPGARSVQDTPTGLLLLLGLGTTGAVALHAAAQWWGARRVGMVLLPRPGWRHPEVRALIRRAMPSLMQAGLGALQLLVLVASANRTAGGVVAFQLAINFYFLPVALGATPIALSLIPRLSRMTSAYDATLFRDTLVRGLSFTFFLVIPAAVAYLVLSGSLARAMSFGAFRSGAGAPLVTSSLLGLAVGVIGESVFLVVTYACYARGDTVTPLRAMVVQTAVCLVGAGLATLVPGRTALLVLGLSLSTGTVIGALLLLRQLLSRLPRGQESLRPAMLRALGSALLMAGPALAVASVVDRTALPFARVGAAILASLTGATVYFAVQLALGAPELVWVRAAVTARLRRRSPQMPTVTNPSDLARTSADRNRLKSLAQDVLALAACLGFGILVAHSTATAMLLLLLILLATAIWIRPVLASYLLVFLTPLTAGIDRGTLIPALRPSEALLFLLVGILFARGLLLARTGSLRLPRLNDVELSLLAMALASSVLPLFVMLVRRQQITGEDLTYSLVLWKLLAVYVVVRTTVTTQKQALRCIVLGMATSVLVSLIGVLQSLGLLGVPALLARFYAPFGVDQALSIGRGSSTLSLPAAVADLATLTLVLALAMLVFGYRNRLLLAGAALSSVLGVIAAAEFSTLIGMVCALGLFVIVTSYRRLISYAVPVAVLGWVLLEPVISNRLSGFQSVSGLPVSWLGRLRNLQTYFWPVLFSDGNWVLGVRPAARVPSAAQEFGWIWIESGYTWLLWGGGVPLLVAYLWFVVTAVRRGLRLTRLGPAVPAVIGTALICFVAVDALVMLFDPHLTYRGSGDALFMLVALSTVVQRTSSPDPDGECWPRASPIGGGRSP